MSDRLLYNVAGHCFAVMAHKGRLADNYRPFAVKEGDPMFVLTEVDSLPDMKQTPLNLASISASDEPLIKLSEARWGEGRSGYCFSMAPSSSHPTVARMLVDREARQAWVACEDGRFRSFSINNSLMLCYAIFTVERDTLLMHASVVVRGGVGYLFLGESGTGKSTHSRLWMEALDGVTLLNDDNPVVRIDENGMARVYGTPWSGKTPCYINDSAPVGAFVALEQAPANVIRRMSLPESYAALLSSSSGLRHESATADGMHNTLSALLDQVPCWHLQCLPNHDAAQICHAAVSADVPGFPKRKQSI